MLMNVAPAVGYAHAPWLDHTLASGALFAPQVAHALSIPQMDMSPLIKPAATSFGSVENKTRKSRRRSRRGGKGRDRRDEETRVDPTDGRYRTYEEFMMRHAQGACFDEGERLWIAAGPEDALEDSSRTMTTDATECTEEEANDDELPPPLLCVRFADQGDESAAEPSPAESLSWSACSSSSPRCLGRKDSILKARSRLTPPPVE